MKSILILALAYCLSASAFADDSTQPQPTGRYFECEIKFGNGDDVLISRLATCREDIMPHILRTEMK